MKKSLTLFVLLIALSFIMPALKAVSQEPGVTQPGTHLVIRESNLREQPSVSSKLKKLIEPGTEVDVTSKDISNGYVHVSAGNTAEGWLLQSNLVFSLLLEAQDSDETGPPAGLGATSPPGCGKHFDDATSCPAVGCANPNQPKQAGNGLSNTIKKRQIDISGQPILLSFGDFRDLQNQTTHANYPIRIYPKPVDRNALPPLKIRGSTLTLREGEYVALEGFISKARTITCGSSESVNCNNTDGSQGDATIVCEKTDIHVPLVEQPSQAEKESVVVEPIPLRPLRMKLKPSFLAKLRDDGTQVMVMGQLFYDSIHQPNPTGSLQGQPARFTVWEVHPVEKFFICKKGDGTNCDASRLSDWEEVK